MAAVKLSEQMKQRQLLSFELFPPKTEKGLARLPSTIEHLKECQPDYVSCTYGAGGSNVGANREVCRLIRDAGILPMTHFTVIRNTKEGMKSQLDQYLAEGVDHVLALRGDIPLGETTTCGDFQYASDLVRFIRDCYGDRFEIAIAGSPEGHIASETMEQDIEVLKMKQAYGADYIMTQLCWDMEAFKRWLDMLDRANITLPVDVGIMPVLDMKATINMALSRNGCVLERKLARLISKYWVFPNPFDSTPAFEDADREQKKADFRKAGMEYTIRQVDEFLSLGVAGIHLYALNKWEAVTEIIEGSGLKALKNAKA